MSAKLAAARATRHEFTRRHHERWALRVQQRMLAIDDRNFIDEGMAQKAQDELAAVQAVFEGYIAARNRKCQVVSVCFVHVVATVICEHVAPALQRLKASNRFFHLEMHYH